MDNLNGLSDELRKIESEFKKKIEPYRTELWKYCFKLTRSPWDAEDLVQETLLKSLSVLAKLFQPINTKAYLFKIATNLWVDNTRRQKNTIHPLNELLVNDKKSTEDFLLMENLDLLVNHLTPNQYVALILMDALQFKGKEVAKIMSTSEGAIHTNLSRARQIMRNAAMTNTNSSSKKKVIRDLNVNPTIEILLQGFRNKDPELIASLLDENVITDITHSGIEYGKNETKKNSLRDWAEIVQKQNIIISDYIELWGRPVIVELERKADNKLYLNNIHYVEIIDEKITYWKFYCFSWDLIKMAAIEMDVELNAEYFYHIF